MSLRTGVVENFTQKFGGGIKIDGKFYDWTEQTRKYGASLKKGDQVQYDLDKVEKHITFIKLVDAGAQYNRYPTDERITEAVKKDVESGNLDPELATTVKEMLQNIIDRQNILQATFNELREKIEKKQLSAEAI